MPFEIQPAFQVGPAALKLAGFAGREILICRRRGNESFGAALLTSCPTAKSGHCCFVHLIVKSALRLSNNEPPTFDGSRGTHHHDTASIMAAVSLLYGAAAMGKSGFARPDAGIFRAKNAPGSGFAGSSRPVRTANRAILRLAGSHGAFSSINGGLARHDGATALGNADLSMLNATFSIGNETPASGVARLPYLIKAFP